MSNPTECPAHCYSGTLICCTCEDRFDGEDLFNLEDRLIAATDNKTCLINTKSGVRIRIVGQDLWDNNEKLEDYKRLAEVRLDLWSEGYHKLKAKNEILQGAIKAHALRFNDAAMVRCYYCIFCGAELGIGAIEHKEDCVVLLEEN